MDLAGGRRVDHPLLREEVDDAREGLVEQHDDLLPFALAVDADAHLDRAFAVAPCACHGAVAPLELPPALLDAAPFPYPCRRYHVPAAPASLALAPVKEGVGRYKRRVSAASATVGTIVESVLSLVVCSMHSTVV